jgi:hypothetical protein
VCVALQLCENQKIIFMVVYSDLYFKSPQIHVFKTKNYGYFRQFIFSQPDSQISCQTLKLKTAAFAAQQLYLHSSFLWTASQPQPKQTGP